MTVVHHFAVLFAASTASWVTSQGAFIKEVKATTKYGDVVGLRRRENYNIGDGAVTDTVDQYLGIPYASPPTGDRRFKPPKPPKPWKGARNCTYPGWVCPQVHYYSQTVSYKQHEDCLNLNIYSPVLDEGSSQLLPVMVYIHGGSYEEGAGVRYDGYSLATHAVVVVTINYRLGVLGYLTSGDARLPGNYGVLDQIEALRWVRRNIRAFQGSSSHVTLFGNSAGSSSIGLLMMAPQAKGLFNQAIMQSGSPVATWAVYNNSVNHLNFVRAVAFRLDCWSPSVDRMIGCLFTVPAQKFVDLHWKFPRLVPSQLNFKPRVDGVLIPDQPAELLRKGLFVRMPLMTGNVKDEWARSSGWFTRDLEGPNIDKNFTDGLNRQTFVKNVDHIIKTRFWWPPLVAEVVKHEYTDWANLSDPFINRDNFIEFMSDLTMIAPQVSLASTLADDSSSSHQPVYYYLVDHQSVHTTRPWWKCYHSLELDWVFGSPFNGYDIATDAFTYHTDLDRMVSRFMMKMWTNFAKTGNPTPVSQEIIRWMSFNSTKLNYMLISALQTTMKEHFRAEKMAFWNKLIPKLLVANENNTDWGDVPSDGISENQTFTDSQTSHVGYKALFWVFMTLSIILLVCFFLCTFKLIRLKQKSKQRAILNSSAPPMA